MVEHHFPGWTPGVSLTRKLLVPVSFLAFATALTDFAWEASAAVPWKAPPAAAIAKMCSDEPISRATWPVWRSRHLEWLHDRSPAARDFRERLVAFVRQEAEANNNTIPGYLSTDAVAWDLYGDALLEGAKPASGEDNIHRAETAYRRSIALDGSFGSPHGGLAAVFASQMMERGRNQKLVNDEQTAKLLSQAEQEIAEYTRLDPNASPESLRGFVAIAGNDFRKRGGIIGWHCGIRPRIRGPRWHWCRPCSWGRRWTKCPWPRLPQSVSVSRRMASCRCFMA